MKSTKNTSGDTSGRTIEATIVRRAEAMLAECEASTAKTQ
jgi:hypothetical protein